MSRIQEILKKAERDGAMQRTRAPRHRTPGVDGAGPRRRRAASRGHGPSRRTRQPRQPRRRPAAVQAAPDRRFADDRRLVAAGARRSRSRPNSTRSLRTRIARAEAPGRAFRTIIVTSPRQGRRQEPDRRESRLDNGAGVPAAGPARRRRPAPPVDPYALRRARHARAQRHPDRAAPRSRTRWSPSPDHRLTILPVGHGAERIRPSCSARPRCAALIDTLRTRFDRIIIDMPPVAPLADVAIAAPLADGVLLIVRAGRDAQAGDRTRPRRTRHVQGARPGPQRCRRGRRWLRTATAATGTSPVRREVGDHAGVQPVRLDAEPDGVRRRGAADLRVGGAGRRAAAGHPGPAREPVEDRAGHGRSASSVSITTTSTT